MCCFLSADRISKFYFLTLAAKFYRQFVRIDSHDLRATLSYSTPSWTGMFENLRD